MLKRIPKDILLSILSILLNIGLFIFGIYMIFRPTIGVLAIHYIFIGFLAIKAIEEFSVYFFAENVLNKKMRLYQAFGFTVLAGLVLLNTNIRVVSLMFIVVGLLLLDTILKFLVAYQYKKSNVKHWWVTEISAIFSIGLIIAILALRISNNLILFRIFGAFTCWEVIVRIYSTFTQGQSLKKARKRWRFNFLFLHEGVYSHSFLPAKVFTDIKQELQEQNDVSCWLQKENVVKQTLDDDKFPLYVTIHSWDGDMFTMKGHSDFEFNCVTYSYGNYDNTHSMFNGSVSEGCLSVVDGELYKKYCLEFEKKVLLRYTLQISLKQKQKLEKYLQEMLKHMSLWEPPIMQDANSTDDASNLYRETNAKFYKFNEGQFKYYFVLNTNCIRFIEQLLQNIQFEDPDILGILTPGDYIEFFEKKLQDKTDTSVISREILMDETEFKGA